MIGGSDNTLKSNCIYNSDNKAQDKTKRLKPPQIILQRKRIVGQDIFYQTATGQSTFNNKKLNRAGQKAKCLCRVAMHKGST